jgi:hypothetical protein
MGAADMALQRCRELAGMRIMHKERLCEECVEPARGKPLVLAAAAVGFENVTRLKLDPRQLVAGGTDALRPLLETWGYSMSQTDALCEMIEVFAARTLFQEKTALPAQVEDRLLQMKEMSGTLAA